MSTRDPNTALTLAPKFARARMKVSWAVISRPVNFGESLAVVPCSHAPTRRRSTLLGRYLP